MPRRGYKRFGGYLKALREGRDLPLTEVAELSRRIATDSAGRLSHPYISQIEGGLRAALSLPKVLSLAAIYAVRPEDLIAQSPPDLRKRLSAQLDAWRREKHPEPQPLRILLSVMRRVQQDMEDELRTRVEDTSFPVNFESEYMSISCAGAAWATVVPFLQAHADAAELIAAFSAEYASLVEDCLGAASYVGRRTAEWNTLADEFHRWLLYARGLGVDLIRLIHRWSIDVTPIHESGFRLTCSFADAKLEAHFGLTMVPLAIVRAVRWRELAQLLFHAGLSSRIPDASEPPPVIEAVLDTLVHVIEPEVPLPITLGYYEAGPIIARFNELLARVPALRHEPTATAAGEVAPIAQFLNRLSPAPDQVANARRPAEKPPSTAS